MWTIYSRDPLLQRQGQIDDYSEFSATSRFNAVGTWSLTLPAASTAAAQLIQPDWGIDLVDDNGNTVFSGPAVDLERERDLTKDQITLSGVDDMICLKDRVAHPQPGSAVPPYTLTDYDVQTGVGSTVLLHYVDVNAAAGAIPARRTVGLTVGADPLIGSSITGRARWEPLHDFIAARALEAGGLGFRVSRVGDGLQFNVYRPVDRTGTVTFSLDLGSMGSYKYGKTRPDCTYAFVGGSGEGTARVVVESQDPVQMAAWGRRIEVFVDRRDTAVADELSGEGAKTLAAGQGKTTLQFVPVDLPGAQYGVDYTLGDTVSYALDATGTEVIREVAITLKPNEVRVVPSIGTPVADTMLATFRQLAALRSRVIQMERR